MEEAPKEKKSQSSHSDNNQSGGEWFEMIKNIIVDNLKLLAYNLFSDAKDRVVKITKITAHNASIALGSFIIITLGSIFILIGLINFLNEFFQSKSAGYIIIGILIMLGGVIYNEKGKQKLDE